MGGAVVNEVADFEEGLTMRRGKTRRPTHRLALQLKLTLLPPPRCMPPLNFRPPRSLSRSGGPRSTPPRRAVHPSLRLATSFVSAMLISLSTSSTPSSLTTICLW
jgi:hypothetical protein